MRPIERTSRTCISGLLCFAVALGACSQDPDAGAARSAAKQAGLTAAECNFFDVNGKDRICHATGSTSNPYVIVQTSSKGCINGHVGHPGDYIATDTDPDCHGGGCFPIGAPVDPKIPCCPGLAVRNGVCVDLCAAVTCRALDQCHAAGTCNPATGACSNPPVAGGTSCNDGNPDTVGDVCTAGACAGVDHCVGVTCVAPDQCHTPGTCIDHATGACSNRPLADGTACTDGNPSTVGDVCTAGLCAGVDHCAGVTCVAQDQCHLAGTCSDHATGACSNPAAADGTACTDGNPSTVGDVCTAGLCAGVDHCAGVTCVAQDQCHLAGTCSDHATGACSSPPAADGTACNDGNPGTLGDVCTAGVCAGRAPTTATLVLTPSASGPLVTGTLASLTATVTDGAGTPLAGQTVQLTVTGPNSAASATAVSDGSGAAHFSYTGNTAGTDTVVASVLLAGQTFTSNSATVAWVTPVQQVATTSVRGRFFASNGSGPFNTPSTATPAFEQFFPTLDFNPPAGTIPGNTSGVGINTRPFTDVTTDLNGNFTGTLVAQGNGHQAGVADLFDFQAVFTSSFVVASPGDVRFDFFSSDGFIFGVGNGATFVTGPRVNVPSSGLSAFDGLPVMGAFNQATAPVANSITVHFPAAGIFPYEVDYSECCAGQLALVMATNTNGGHGVPPAGSLVLTPNAPAGQPAGAQQTFTVTAVDSSNVAQGNVLVTLDIAGANAQQLTGRTNAQGRATFSYLGAHPGTDTLQAQATMSSSSAFSNRVDQLWQLNPGQPAIIQPATAAQVVVPGASVALSVRATDDGGEAGLTYAWGATGPAAVTFTPNGTNAAKDTIATFTAAGDYTLSVTVTDASGLAAVSSVTLTVRATLTSISVSPGNANASVGVPVHFATTAVDQFGSVISAALGYQWSATGAGGAVFSAPTAAATDAVFDTGGGYQVSVTASDGTRTATGTATATVSTQVVNHPPVVNAGPGATLVQPAHTFALQGSASDDGLPAGSALTVTWSRVSGPTAVTFADLHQTTTQATFSDVGVFVLRLTATDGALSSSADVTVVVQPPAGAPPTVSLTSPLDGSTLANRTAVTGTVGGGFWTLAYVAGGASSVAPTVFASGTGAVSGTLGTFDPTVLLDGAYDLVLTATTDQGTATASVGVTVIGKPRAGVFSLTVQDLELRLGGQPFRLTRTYDARDTAQGTLGIGWNLAPHVRVEHTQPPGQFWEEIQRTIFFFPQFCVQPTKPAQVALTFDDGRTFKFDVGVDLGGGSGACSILFPAQFGTLTFTPSPGTVGSLVALDTSSFFVSGGPVGPIQLLDDGTFDLISPHRYQLTTGDGTVYVLSQSGGVESVTDRNGAFMTFGAGGIISSSGQTVPFARDALGRITTITDLNGATLQYAYDANGNLASATARTGETTTYGYDDFHRLATITSPSGVVTLRNAYDVTGRLTRVTDALGGVITYAYDLANDTTTVTDRNGHTTSLRYDAFGDVVAQTDGLGHTTTRTFDANGNLTTETDPLGGVSRWEHDPANRVIAKTDPNGATTTFTLNEFGLPLVTTDPLGRTSTNTYDGRGNLTGTVDGDGNLTTHTYDAAGRLLTTTDAAGATVAFVYDAFGNPLQLTDGVGVVFSYVVDANGARLSQSLTRTTPQGPQAVTTGSVYDASARQISRLNPDGTATHTEYDVDGHRSADVDEFGNRTAYRYDGAGRSTETDFADGTRELRSYDANGNLLSATDRAGHVTTYAYDAADHLILTTFADGTTRQAAYDADGRRIAETDENGVTSVTTYDAAGHVTQATSATGTLTFGYDLAGNATTRTDATGNATHVAYDSQGRVLQVTAPDGTTTSSTFSGVGTAPLTVVDQAGITTHFTYDGDGRLTQVVDGAGQTTMYAYDEAGNRTSVTDANHHTTRLEHDALGREVKRTLPGGASELRAYDAAGHLVAKTDFAGHTTHYTYDTAGRLLTTAPDASLSQAAIHFTYSATGHRASMTDATGTTTWTYDARERVVAKAAPFGTLVFTYDAAGYRTSLRSDDAAGISVDYARDATNRLVTVSDRGLSTQLGYDAAGALTSMLFPNGTSTSLQVDPLRRVSSLTTRHGPQVLASYAYTFLPTGVPSSLTESSGRTVQWTHDALSRLLAETLSGDPNGVNGAVSYTWDAAGNRLSRASSVAPVAPQSSTYDADDRLTSDTSDADGNVLSANGTSYTYDFERRLVSASSGVTLAYDGLGHLVSRSSSGVTTTFLVDDVDSAQPARIVEERVAGHAVRSFVFAEQPLLLRDTGGAHCVHADSRGDVRLLTDASGAVTDSYDYDAYGLALHSSGTTVNPLRHRGERLDPDLGFTWLGDRWLRHGEGRFLTRDALDGYRYPLDAK